MQLSIVKNYIEGQSEIGPMDADEALWNLVYCRAEAPQVRVYSEDWVILVEYNHGVMSYLSEELAEWVYNNIHSHSAIRVVLNIAPHNR